MAANNKTRQEGSERMQDMELKHYRAIAALLECDRIVDAAKQAGVGERTLRRWLADPRWEFFQKAYAEAKSKAARQALGRIQHAVLSYGAPGDDRK